MKPKEKVLKRLAGCEMCRKSCSHNTLTAVDPGREGVLFGCNTSNPRAFLSHLQAQRNARVAKFYAAR